MTNGPTDALLASQFATALDLIGKVGAMASEDVILARLFEVFEITCGATEQTWLPIGESGVTGTPTWYPSATPDRNGHAALHRDLTEQSAHQTHGPLDVGFWFRIGESGGVLGVFLITGICFPENRSRYLSYALGIADVCALAIRNARTYEQLCGTEGRLAAERERLSVTLQSIGDGVIATDVDGLITLQNRVSEELTGWDTAHALGRPLAEVFMIVDERTRERCESPVDMVLRTNQVVGLAGHTVLLSRDGREHIIGDSGAPIRNSSGDIEGVVLVYRDITAQRELEREAMRSSKLASLGLLAGGIAHDFNNLLTAILGNVVLAKETAAPGDKLHALMSAAERAAIASQGLTDQLLTFAKGGAPVKVLTDTEALIRDTVSLAVHGSSCALIMDLADNLRAADIDRGQIGQVLNNIVLNAVQAMPDGGTLLIRARNLDIPDPAPSGLLPGRHIEITVTDDGPGIAPEHIEHVFDPFFSTKKAGHGLGLATSYSIVRRHHGDISVTSRPGQGSTFCLVLPALAADPVASACASPPTGGRGGRVLVMDDQSQILDLLEEVLADTGYDVTTTRDGQEAIDSFRSALDSGSPYDLIIADMTVPGGLGGAAVLEAVQAMDGNARVIASSGYSVRCSGAEMMEGFAAVLQKPYSPGALRETVARVLAGV